MKIKTKIIAGTLLCTISAYQAPIFAYTKDETVYSKANTEGKPYQTIVSTHIENKEQANEIQDLTNLLNIENRGEENQLFTQNGETLQWKANQKDIYYQGESKKELPIECKVTYELEGKEMTAEEIVGKAGKVKITIKYQNKEEHIVTIQGKEQKLYTPFVVIAGTILPNDKNQKITISNGKVIDDGTKTIAVGIALPGLQESLGSKEKELEIPDKIEITMETTEFSLGNIVNMITPKIIEESDLNFMDNLDPIYDKANDLEQASKQIQTGSNELAKGTNQLALRKQRTKRRKQQSLSRSEPNPITSKRSNQ